MHKRNLWDLPEGGKAVKVIILIWEDKQVPEHMLYITSVGISI